MERNGDYVEKCHCVPSVFNKLQDKKYLRFSFDSPSYVGVKFGVLYQEKNTYCGFVRAGWRGEYLM